MTTSIRNFSALFVVIGVSLGGVGCGVGGVPGGADGNADKPVGEPNNTFAQAIAAIFEADVANLQGTIENTSDVDVYSLGPMLPGDRIFIQVDAQTSGLDAAIALFDKHGRLFTENDDRNLAGNDLNPQVNRAVRWGSNPYYVAIAAAPFNLTTGSYQMTVTVSRGGPVPPKEQAVFFLDFDGGTVSISGENIGNIPPFDTGDIDSDYDGMTAAVQTAIVDRFMDAFDGVDVVTVTSDQGEAAAGPAFSRILFGGFDATKFGISEAVDPFNEDDSDDAIIFTETFTPSLFGRTLSANELGTAIGNVAAHEGGHLLGLNHVADITALMDTTGGPDTLLVNQLFKDTPLDDSIFPIGSQDGWLLLKQIVGLE